MALTEHYYTKFEEGKFYHVYNRVVDKKPMFTQKRNYYYFKTRMVKYIIPLLDVYTFCLLGNHFHLMVKIKDLATLEELPNLSGPNLSMPNIEDVAESETAANQEGKCHYLVSSAFKKMFQSYAMAFNKQESRIGALFQEPFKRSLIDTKEYLMHMIYYIHFNPQKHGLISDFRNYPHSSYNYYVHKKKCHWMHEELFDLFGGYDGFMEFHNRIQDDPDQKHIIE